MTPLQPYTGGRPLSVVTRTVPKRDRAPHENEDSVAGDTGQGRFAIADGASTSARPEVWSGLLASTFVNGDNPLAPEVLARLRADWWQQVYRPSLPWFAQEKLSRGGDATFVGLHVVGRTYLVLAVGDSCLFHIRNGEILCTAPLDRADQFSRFPDLVSTRFDAPRIGDELWVGGGMFADGDVLLLATDALAHHLLDVYERCGELPPVVDNACADEKFAEFVEDRRRLGMANDDTTVCVVTT